MTYQRRNDVAVGEVRALLGRNRQSIRELSEATHITISTLNSRLLGQRPFKLDELERIAAHFNVSFQSLITVDQERAS